jgi:hypothetical protein
MSKRFSEWALLLYYLRLWLKDKIPSFFFLRQNLLCKKNYSLVGVIIPTTGRWKKKEQNTRHELPWTAILDSLTSGAYRCATGCAGLANPFASHCRRWQHRDTSTPPAAASAHTPPPPMAAAHRLSLVAFPRSHGAVGGGGGIPLSPGPLSWSWRRRQYGT